MNLHSAALFVVATKKRPAIVLEALAGVPHQVVWTTDYKLEEGWKPLDQHASLVQNQVGAMRCWRGHQDALKAFLELPLDVDAALVMEDDAWPNVSSWPIVVSSAIPLLEEFEAVSLHGRAFREIDFDKRQLASTGRDVLVPKAQGQTWVQGSLAYLIRRSAAMRWVNATYDGYPSDLFLCNRFHFALVNPSPFDHNRKHGSLIDCPTPKD